MKNGFTLLECLVATTILLVVLIGGYGGLAVNSDLADFVVKRTRGEQESNYRFLAMQSVLGNCSDALKSDFYLAQAPHAFTDLNFGTEFRSDAFSVACGSEPVFRFEDKGGYYCTRQKGSVAVSSLILLAGSTANGNYTWNYARVSEVIATADGDCLSLTFLRTVEPPVRGTAAAVAVHGFQFQENTLYWIAPSGTREPFFNSLESFSYNLQPPRLTVKWQISGNETEFVLQP